MFGKEYTKVFMCFSLMNGYIIKIKCRVINLICSARREECFSFVGIKIFQPQFCPVAYSVKVNIKNLSCRVREVNYNGCKEQYRRQTSGYLNGFHVQCRLCII